jgi:hypothetical protein
LITFTSIYLCFEPGVFNSFAGIPEAKLACKDNTGGVKRAAGEEFAAAVVGEVRAAEEAASELDKSQGMVVLSLARAFQ